MEKHKDSEYFKDREFKFPPDAWIPVKGYKCSNCEAVVEAARNICPECRATMKIVIY